MRSLEDAEQRLADVRVSAAEDKSGKNGTSPQKDSALDDELKELVGHNADDRQNPRHRATSQPLEELNIHSLGDKMKSNKTSVFSKTSNVRRVLDLELKALKDQEELQARLTKLKRRKLLTCKKSWPTKLEKPKRKLKERRCRVAVGLTSEVSHQLGLQTTI